MRATRILFKKAKDLVVKAKPLEFYVPNPDLNQRVHKYSDFIKRFNISDSELEDAQEQYLSFLQLRGKMNDQIRFMYATHLLRPRDFRKFIHDEKLKIPKPWFDIKDGKVRVKHLDHEQFDSLPSLELDLIDEARGQLRFNNRVKELNVDDEYISTSIGKYTKFLALKKKYPTVAVVPTLDIDLIWHTHQLDSSQYDRDMRKYFGYLLNHNDMASNEILFNAFGTTKDLWKKEFGEDYISKQKVMTLTNTEKKTEKKTSSSDQGVSWAWSCLSCGFGDHYSHRSMPHSTGDVSTLPNQVSQPDLSMSMDTSFEEYRAEMINSNFEGEIPPSTLDSTGATSTNTPSDSIIDADVSCSSCLSCVTDAI